MCPVMQLMSTRRHDTVEHSFNIYLLFSSNSVICFSWGALLQQDARFTTVLCNYRHFCVIATYVTANNFLDQIILQISCNVKAQPHSNRSIFFTSAQYLFSLVTIGLHVSTVIQSSSGPSRSCKSEGAVRTLGSQMCLH